jgi:hypothetical protein
MEIAYKANNSGQQECIKEWNNMVITPNDRNTINNQ